MSTLFRKWFPKNQGHPKIDLQTGFFTLDKIKIATKNFDSANKIGGFGSVYKGKLSDGTHIAVKKLSSHSKKGCREFINEIGMISALEHPNIVKLYGGCMDKEQLLLVYEYVENSSLSHALFGEENTQLRLDWRTRKKICGGIARGLAYLHEESRLKIVHRDIKATNVLLDKHLNPKISDFGLARLNDVEKTHISTRIAGTLGYMAPEYIRHGYLTDKADVYSFGIVMLETISGKRNTLSLPEEGCLGLVYKANILLERGTLLDIVDSKLGLNYNRDEAIRIIKISLLCTNSIPTLRPSMSNVVKMLEGREDIREPISNVSSVIDRSLYDVCQERLQSLEKGDFSLNIGDRSPPYLDARLNSRASSQYLLDYQI